MTSPSRQWEREAFLSEWRYQAGEHVTILGPTGWGKTHFAYQLLDRASKPELPAVVFVMKPRDRTAVDFNARLGYRRIPSWPPARFPWTRPPRGYTLWPKHSMDLESIEDDDRMRRTFLAAMGHAYRRGRHILFADEVAGLSNELGLKRPLTTVWMRGRSMGTGLWAASQRPVDIPLHAYSQAEHLFLANDPDKRTRDRYGEIGGIDRDVVIRETSKLRRYEWLYIRRTAGDFRVIGP